MLPALKQSVKEKFNLDIDWYGGYDYRSWPPTELRTYHHAPRYLTNYMGLRNRMAILSETFSHDRFYKRVHAAMCLLRRFLNIPTSMAEPFSRLTAKLTGESPLPPLVSKMACSFPWCPVKSRWIC